MKLVDVVLLN